MNLNMWQTGVISLVVAAVIGLAKLLRTWTSEHWPKWRQRRRAAADARRFQRDLRQREQARQAAIAAATAEGRVIAVEHQRDGPVAVRFSDNTWSFYFSGDRVAYTAAMRSGDYPPTRTFPNSPPPLP
ncbi:hypothetical protein ACIO52_32020 [Nocardia sp. NPDC087230]|uniref:hypothetical protein n=1 Tax=Nocardia sp. NPDC087230 TaxID=3364331 RepID=UPI00380EE5FD